MSFRVKTRLTGANVTEPVFDPNDPAQAQCRTIFSNYKSNGWIESYDVEVVSSSEKVETIIFDTESRWTDFRNELSTATGDTQVSVFTTEIIEETQV